MFWLVFDTDDGRVILLQPASALIFARFTARLHKLVDGDFVEGHQLDSDTVRRIPTKMMGKPLTAQQAEALLQKLG